MVTGKLRAKDNILDKGKKTVRHVFPPSHAAAKCAAAENAGSKDTGIKLARHQRHHRWNELWRVLIIRMNHYDDVSPCGKRVPVASLLVRAITAIHRVNLHLHSIKCACDRDSLILSRIVHY